MKTEIKKVKKRKSKEQKELEKLEELLVNKKMMTKKELNKIKKRDR